MLAVSTAHTAIICYAVYECLIVNFGNFDYLTKAEWCASGLFVRRQCDQD
mgnify:CR=1